MIDEQYKRTLQNILKLPVNSPSVLVYFVSGSLPGSAILHLKQLTLFGMISPLNIHAHHVLLTPTSSPQSWFLQIREILLQYQLPHPLVLLANPPTKESFKKLVKAKVTDYWESKLRSEASFLPSLHFLRPQYMSLFSPHQLLTTAGSKPYEVAKA